MFDFPLNKKFRSIRRDSMELEFQEVLLDSIAQKKGRDSAGGARRMEVAVPKKSLTGLQAVFILILGILLAKTIQLQFLDGRIYNALSLKNSQVDSQLLPPRGVIYDHAMTQLAFNKSTLDLAVDKRKLPKESTELSEEIKIIANMVKEDPTALLARIRASNVMVETVAGNINYEALLAFEGQKERLPGFFILNSITREYPYGAAFSHLIGYMGQINEEELKQSGYTNTDRIGKSGLERSYESVLRGEPGIAAVERNALGDVLSQQIIKEATGGHSLVLWLDAELQKKLTEILGSVMANVGSKKAAAIAIDPKSGGVMAMVSIPSFDNNLFAQGIKKEELAELQQDPLEPLFPRAIAGQYPTGSTIKPFIGAAALEEGVIDERTQIFAPLELCVKNIYSGGKECHEDWTFHGWTDIKRAIAESINPFFYIIGGGYKKNEFSDPRLPEYFDGLGVTRIGRYLSLFGWGRKPGIDLPGEAAGRIPGPDWKKEYFDNPQDKVWRLGDTYNLSIGQGYLLATPLQVASAFVAIANGGTLYKPQLVYKIVDSEKNVIQEFGPEVARDAFIAPENMRIIKEGMRDAVRYGSATFLGGLPVEAAAKTGTAQISANSDLYYNWITVFAPYDDPQIVLTVVIENVKGIQAAALPVAGETLEWYFTPSMF